MNKFPYDESFGIDGPDGSPLYGKAAEDEWKSRYCDAWCKQMVDTYGINYMLKYPYGESFGVDGPDGSPLYGRDAEREWRKRYRTCHKAFREARIEARRTYRQERRSKRDPWCLQMIELYTKAKMMEFPYDASFGVDGPDGSPLYGQAAEDEWKRRYSIDPWFQQMIELYTLGKMCCYPYDASFGIDGPDGSPLYGEAAENEWKSRYISDSSSDEFDFLSSSESDGEGRRRRKKKKEKHRRRRPKREEPSTDSDW